LIVTDAEVRIEGVNPAFLVSAILAGILLWGLLLWTVLRAVFVKLSGWNELARRYPALEPVRIWHWRGQTVKVGAVRYRRTMRVAALPDALYLAESGLLRHQPLRIPWPELAGAAPSSFYGRPSVAVTVGRPPAGIIEFPVPLYDAICAATAANSR
jgi:hypothetical protein